MNAALGMNEFYDSVLIIEDHREARKGAHAAATHRARERFAMQELASYHLARGCKRLCHNQISLRQTASGTGRYDHQSGRCSSNSRARHLLDLTIPRIAPTGMQRMAPKNAPNTPISRGPRKEPLPSGGQPRKSMRSPRSAIHPTPRTAPATPPMITPRIRPRRSPCFHGGCCRCRTSMVFDMVSPENCGSSSGACVSPLELGSPFEVFVRYPWPPSSRHRSSLWAASRFGLRPGPLFSRATADISATL